MARKTQAVVSMRRERMMVTYALVRGAECTCRVIVCTPYWRYTYTTE